MKREFSLITEHLKKSESESEDEDEDEENPPPKKLKVAGLAGVGCQFLPMIQEKVLDERE